MTRNSASFLLAIVLSTAALGGECERRIALPYWSHLSGGLRQTAHRLLGFPRRVRASRTRENPEWLRKRTVYVEVTGPWIASDLHLSEKVPGHPKVYVANWTFSRIVSASRVGGVKSISDGYPVRGGGEPEVYYPGDPRPWDR